jgi:hypothetical protein
MNNIWNKYDNLLSIVEELATWEGAISSEEELSELFDSSILPMVVDQYSEDDTVAINEAFGNWADSLVSDGTLHEVQYENYEYVGKLSE